MPRTKKVNTTGEVNLGEMLQKMSKPKPPPSKKAKKKGKKGKT